jgi:hypothetical protein
MDLGVNLTTGAVLDGGAERQKIEVFKSLAMAPVGPERTFVVF